MKKKYIIFLSLLFTISFYSQPSKYEQSVQHIKSTLNCDIEYAEWVISTINLFAKKLQSDIEYIANSDDTYSQKVNYIPKVISNSFVNRSSKIDVSSKTRKTISTYSIQQYLYRLSKLKKIYGYSKVELLYEPDYLGMGRFYGKYKDNSGDYYELSIAMWQVFRAWFGDNRMLAYGDVTKKKFRLRFYVDSENRLKHIKVNRVFVSETIDIEKLNTIRRN